jgi:hypothetical protein
MVCRMMPGPWPSGDDTAADDYPERADGIRRPGSRPLADFLGVPLAIVIGIAMVVGLCAGLLLVTSWGGLLAAMLLLAAGATVALLVRGVVELVRSR